MAKVYSPPKEVGPEPEFKAGESFDDYLKRQQDYTEAVVRWAKANGSGDYAGEEVSFPQGDGYAHYIVVSTKPLKLIWLPVGDAWQYPYIERLTAKDIKEKIEQQRRIAKLFAAKRG